MTVRAIRFCVYGNGGWGIIRSTYTPTLAHASLYTVGFNCVDGGRWTTISGRTDGSVAEGNANGCSIGGSLLVHLSGRIFRFNWHSAVGDINYHCSIGVTTCNLILREAHDRTVTGLLKCSCIQSGCKRNNATGTTKFQ